MKTWWPALLSVLLGLMANEIGDVSPWLAKRIIRWSAARWSADSEEAAALAEEWSALLDERPGKLLKLFTALGFAARATMAQQHRRLDAALPQLRNALIAHSQGLLLVRTWVVAAALISGAIYATMIFSRSFTAYPIASTVAVTLFALYVVPFWYFLREQDLAASTPRTLMGVAFAWGAVVAAPSSIPAGAASSNIIAKLASPAVAADWGTTVSAALVQENLKVLGVVVIVLVTRRRWNSALDGLIYGALVGLGFQVTESILTAVGSVALAGRGDAVNPVLGAFLIHGFLAGPWSHVLYSALAGFGIGYFLTRHDRTTWRRTTVAVASLVAGCCCHILWDAPLFVDVLPGSFGVLATLMLKGLPGILLLYFMLRTTRVRLEGGYVRQLAALRDPDFITTAELAVLASAGLRIRARRYASHVAGARAGRTVLRLQRAQARLAVAMSTPAGTELTASAADGTHAAAIARCQREVLALRRALVALGHPEAVSQQDRATGWSRFFVLVATTALAVIVLWAALMASGTGLP